MDPSLVSLAELEERFTGAIRRHGRPCLRTGLWVAGSLEGLHAPAVAVVGTRAPSDAGRRLSRRLGHALAAAGVCVVSGLALGIDAAAHEGALDAGGPTIGVLGGGHTRFFPRANQDLAARIVAGGGAVVSPYPPDEPARPFQFLQRNAVVAGLVDAVVIVEAAARSGALNTAGHAAERGIPVLAVPGDVDRPKVQGCLALIRDGAILVRDADDVLEALPAGVRARTRREPAAGAARGNRPDSGPLSVIVNALADGELGFEALRERVGLDPAALAAALVELELGGRVEARAGARFARSAPAIN